MDGGKKSLLLFFPDYPLYDFLIGSDDHLSLDNASDDKIPKAELDQIKESGYQQEGGDGAADKPEGNGPASARGAVNRYLPQHPESNLACGSAQERINATKHQDNKDNLGEVW
jgi:hypothetical protein